MSNAAIARALSEMASMMELLGEDSFRVLAYSRAARAVEDFPGDIASIARGATGAADLRKIEGLGPKTAEKIVEWVTTGAIAEHAELAAKVPAGLLQLLQLQGIGPKTVRVFWTQAGVTSLADLHRIIADGSILKLPRMGEKSVEKLKAAISMLSESTKRHRLGPATVLAEAVIAHLKTRAKIERIEAAGSLRRGRETVGDLDILVATADPAGVVQAFVTMPGVTAVLQSGETRASCRVRLSAGEAVTDDGEAPIKDAGEDSGPTMQVDVKVVPLESWGAALMYFTGSKDFNVALRGRAQDRGLTLNEYGLFPEDHEKTPPQARHVRPLAGKTEESICEALGVAWVPPEIREGRGELDVKGTPRLIELGDIRAELHSHTTASDGVLSIVELAKEAKRRGFHTLAITDHSQSSVIANGLKPDRLRRHIRAIHAAQEDVKGITLLAGSEVDILPDGRLDYDDELLAELDVVVASPHAALKQEPKAATKRLIRAVSHPLVHILGHPTGRLIMRRSGLEPDMAEVIAAAKAHGTALEINAHWMRLDLRDVHVRMAVEAGCAIAINCDVHHPADFDNLRFGVTTGRRGWLRAEACVNTWSAKDLHAWLKKKRR
jgi:DNA polymerase (family 10)